MFCTQQAPHARSYQHTIHVMPITSIPNSNKGISQSDGKRVMDAFNWTRTSVKFHSSYLMKEEGSTKQSQLSESYRCYILWPWKGGAFIIKLCHVIPPSWHTHTWSDNKVRKLATVCLPWQHWTKALVWFDDNDISAFHGCDVVDLWQSLSEWHLLLSACVLACRRENVRPWITATNEH